MTFRFNQCFQVDAFKQNALLITFPDTLLRQLLIELIQVLRTDIAELHMAERGNKVFI